jgi:metal-responsive CopG/Arc/MetJ family transcriptional regulator
MDPVYALRIPPELVARVDAWAEAQDSPISRSEAIRALIEQALRRQKA